jgi:hypothetical protein
MPPPQKKLPQEMQERQFKINMATWLIKLLRKEL